YIRGRWEAPYLEVADLTEDDPSIIDEYTIESNARAKTAEEIEQIAQFVDDLRKALGQNRLADWRHWGGRWRTTPFAGHMYQPLLYVGKNAAIRVIPVALNDSEA